MSARTAERWDLVGGDPAPGEPSQVLSKADVFKSVADNADRCRTDLTELRRGNADFWQGEASNSFRKELDETSNLPSDLLKLTDSFRIAEAALRRYSRELTEHQSDSRAALHRATNAHDDETRSSGRLQSLNVNCQNSEQLVRAARDHLARLRGLMLDPAYSDRSNAANVQWAADIDRRYGQARSNLSNAESSLATARRSEGGERRTLDDARQRLGAARRQIDEVRARRNSLVESTVADIERASDAGIKNNRWWKDPLGYIGSKHWADHLETYGKYLNTVAIGLAVALVVVAVAVVLFKGVVVLVAVLAAIKIAMGVVSAVTLAVDLVLYSQGKKTAEEVAWSVFDVALTVLLFKGAGSAAKAAAKGAVKGSAKGAPKIVAMMKSIESGIGTRFVQVKKFASHVDERSASYIPKKLFMAVHSKPTGRRVMHSMNSFLRDRLSSTDNYLVERSMLAAGRESGNEAAKHLGRGAVEKARDVAGQLTASNRYPNCYSPVGSW